MSISKTTTDEKSKTMTTQNASDTADQTRRISLATVEYDNQKKTPGIAYALWFFLGVFGGHRWYAGDSGVGIAMLLTAGGLGVWALIDGFFIGKRIRQVNTEIRDRIMAQYGVTTHA